MTSRGAVLLEVLIAVAVLLMASITITGAVNQGVRVMERSRMELRAADLARSAMSEIEAGIETPESLHGPVREPETVEDSTEGEGAGSFGAAFSDGLPPESGWELEVGVEPSPFAGLAKVTVRAVRRSGGELVEASYTLAQLVRLGGGQQDRAGEAGGLTIESERGLGGPRERLP